MDSEKPDEFTVVTDQPLLGTQKLKNNKVSEDGDDSIQSVNTSIPDHTVKWTFFGTDVPRGEMMYLCQMLLIFIVAISSIVMLALPEKENTTPKDRVFGLHHCLLL